MRFLLQICVAIVIALDFTQSIAFSTLRLEIKSTIGTPGTKGNEVTVYLDNQKDTVSHLQFELCDRDNYITLEDVLPTPRSQKIQSIEYGELKNGCAKIMLSSKDDNFIEKGRGSILILKFVVSLGAPLTEHRKITFDNVCIKNPLGASLEVTLVPGAFVFIVCQGTIKKVLPNKIIASRKKSTIHPLLVIGEDTYFNRSSRFYFNPRDEIECLWQVGFGNYLFAIIEVPAAPPEGFADVGIYTNCGEAVVNGSNVFEVVSQ